MPRSPSAACQLLRVGGLLVSAMALSCQGDSAFRAPDPGWNRMLEVPRYDPYEEGAFFEDGMAMRSPPPGTFAYEEPLGAAFGGGVSHNAFVSRFPLEVTLALLQQGRASFEVVCAACHGVDGNGNEMVARHMARRPPSLHEDRVRRLSPGEIYFVISKGYGLMPGYSAHLSVHERWAVAAYVKALELSWYAPLASLSPALKRKLKGRLP